MIITIDGYAGSGKSAAAAALAAALGFELLNTGGMYRAAGLALLHAGIDIYAEPRPDVSAFAETFAFDMPPGRVLLNGRDFTPHIATEDAGRAASRVGTFAEVRARLKREQRRIADDRDIVCEGRDQGTAVFPDAAVKFFFTASAEVRADRRAAQLHARGLPADRAAILTQIKARDQQDESRPIDPLARAADAVPVDTTALPPDAVLALMLDVVTRCRSRR